MMLVQSESTKKGHIFTRDFLLIFLAGGFIRICYQMRAQSYRYMAISWDSQPP